MEVFKLGLWAMWLSGTLLIALSYYSIQLLPAYREELTRPEFGFKGSEVLRNPSITMLTVPRFFNGSLGSKQAVAIRSWLGLSPLLSVVLFGNDPSLQSFATELGSRVFVEANIDLTFTGTPFFHSIVTRAQAFPSDIAVLVDPETILLPDFISTLRYAHELDQDWFLVASPRRISHFPFYLDEGGKHWLREDQKGLKLKKDMISHNGLWDCCEGRMLMAWNHGDMPLHIGVVPPFLYGKGLHNYWFINEVFFSKYRFVFDASWAMSSFYLNDSSYNGKIFELERRSWEYDGNRHLGQLYGLLSFREANFADFVKLVLCHGKFIFTNSALDTLYSFGEKRSSKIWEQKVFHFRKENKVTNFLVCALDDDTYYFSVLQILKLGYNVLMSDVDVYWFKNPLPFVQTFGPAVFAAQSDEYNITGPINLPRRLNSGFYYAQSDASTIAAMEKVVKHALSSELSEQPSFYDTLCGEGGSKRLGDNQCREPETNVTVQFLDRDLFPNGAYQGLWEKSDVKAACTKKGCYVLHNNWISGRLKKLERQSVKPAQREELAC
ncbi:hypothetical protein V2J09_003903 [Rumex salicifolius]